MEKIKIYIDMDGCIAKWNMDASIEDTFEPGYFAALEPDERLIDAVKMLSEEYDVSILSAVYQDNHSMDDKITWLDNNGLGHLQRIFVPYGQPKQKYIDQDFTSILIDDYSKNLEEWILAKNCYGIKYLNGINATKGMWNGFMISSRMNPNAMCTTIKGIVSQLIAQNTLAKSA
ncbi:5' nucleotidase, deoxy (Pyrimidine), type C protein (NT5C) [Pseudobutyrivibrio sp. NOR37]|uniref:5' nucleotidase, deoxy (Pyrimidine), type C protein (NT5C) n=1 Tax=Pseudobutyrivibrio xylanivorans TaxID=185007 RepID=A0A6M0LHM2_PSEXY|nr:MULTISPECIES: hypothetical protein [Pseudobutyrivibrio]NEX02002.1 hypothetical protein [Pseudobutyrivibrio xylanivorans]SFR73456.1 5' nucleotidase, deoxy (Pyrimidine), type C protein (NT5C) [Pseudobutyrivibrio sp. NOR37]